MRVPDPHAVGTTATSVAEEGGKLAELVLHDWDFNFPAVKREFDDAAIQKLWSKA